MKNIVAVVLTIAILGGMAWVMWTFKGWIIGISLVIVLINMAIERITGKPTKLHTWAKKQ